MKKLTTGEFIARAIFVHCDKYDYSKANYVNSRTKVCIICPKHGEFWQRPNDHLKGKGCYACFGKKKYTTEKFIARAKKIHGDKYDYSLVNYRNLNQKITIGCPIHGWFEQSAGNHLNGQGCRKCASAKNDAKKRFSHNQIIELFTKSKGKNFDYSRVEYKNMATKVTIGCPKHGWFIVKPHDFIHGVYGCPKCWKEHIGKSNGFSLEEFKDKANKAHNYKYCYDLVEFNTTKDKVKIICPIHGIFEQEANSHTRGVGCPKCKCYSRGEKRIESFLKDNNIKYKTQYIIANENLFCDNNRIYVDFYLPEHNMIIEFNGAQHYKPIKFWGGNKIFEKQIERDIAVKTYCKLRKITLLEIPYNHYKDIESILTKKLKIKRK